MQYKKYLLTLFLLTFAAGVNADTIGQDQSFYISSQYDAQSRNQISATLRGASEHAYFYVEDSYWGNLRPDVRNQVLNWITSLGHEFDSRIYPTETQFFGSESNPGIDNDPRLTILLSPLIENAGGYFDTSNEYSKQGASNSNEREMVYLNIAALGDQRKIETFLAHEFQHLISFNQKEKLRGVSDDTWLNELRSEYAVTLLGYNDDFAGSTLEKRLKVLTESPSDSLTEWKNLTADYGQIGLFAEYLAEHWSSKVIADTLKNGFVGIISLNEALKQNGFADSFTDVLTQWAAANLLNDMSVNPKFGYTREGLRTFHVVPTKVLNNLGDNITLTATDGIKDWQERWYDVSQFAAGQKNYLKINFSSPSLASFYIPYIVFKTDGSQTLFVFSPTFNSSTLYVNGLGTDVKRVIFMPIKKDKISGFTFNETAIPLALSVERAETAVPQSPAPLITPTPTALPSADVIESPTPEIPDGSLIRAEGDYKVYEVQNRWRRHIISSKIFSFYSQFGFDKVKVVASSVLAQYQESNLIREQDGQKVYGVDESGEKHWLDISAEQFSASGRTWDSIFSVNLSELNFYKQGAEIRN